MHRAIGLTERNKSFSFIAWLLELHAQLSAMSRKQNIFFLADCCQRLSHNYEKFADEVNWGDPALVRTSIEFLQHSATTNCDSPQITSLTAELMKIAPDTEDFTSEYTSAALDAVAALTYSFEYCMDGNVEHGVQVACLCRDTAYEFASHRDQHGYTIDTDEDETRVYNDPLLQQELFAQQAAITRATNEQPSQIRARTLLRSRRLLRRKE